MKSAFLFLALIPVAFALRFENAKYRSIELAYRREREFKCDEECLKRREENANDFFFVIGLLIFGYMAKVYIQLCFCSDGESSYSRNTSEPAPTSSATGATQTGSSQSGNANESEEVIVGSSTIICELPFFIYADGVDKRDLPPAYVPPPPYTECVLERDPFHSPPTPPAINKAEPKRF